MNYLGIQFPWFFFSFSMSCTKTSTTFSRESKIQFKLKNVFGWFHSRLSRKVESVKGKAPSIQWKKWSKTQISKKTTHTIVLPSWGNKLTLKGEINYLEIQFNRKLRNFLLFHPNPLPITPYFIELSYYLITKFWSASTFSVDIAESYHVMETCYFAGTSSKYLWLN